jgi:hypothetical protein
MTPFKKSLSLLASVSAIMLASCGGSGGGSDSPSAASVLSDLNRATTTAQANEVTQETMDLADLGAAGTVYRHFTLSANNRFNLSNAILLDNRIQPQSAMSVGSLLSYMRTTLRYPGLPSDADALTALQASAISAWAPRNDAQSALLLIALTPGSAVPSSAPSVTLSTPITLFRSNLLGYWYTAKFVTGTARAASECENQAYADKAKRDLDIIDEWIDGAWDIWDSSGTHGPEDAGNGPGQFAGQLGGDGTFNGPQNWATQQGMNAAHVQQLEALWNRCKQKLADSEDQLEADLEDCHEQ